MMISARVCVFCMLSFIVVAPIDGGRNSRFPRSAGDTEATRFCSWLKSKQLKQCNDKPHLGLSARYGVELALKECQKQFTDHRWNCSRVTVADVFQRERMLKAAFRESAYLHAIIAAGVAYQITKGCSEGNWDECGCDNRMQGRGQKTGEPSWEWGGCSENIRFGYDFSTEFMDPPRNGEGDITLFTNIHNNEVGRRVIKDNMGKSCKCHGVSGSCTVRVCWRTMPKITKVAVTLRKKFDQALKVKLNRSKTKLTRLSRGRRGRKRDTNKRRPSSTSLVYSKDSPDFCRPDDKIGVLGTVGRTCNKTSSDMGGCRQMCCGRGYNTVDRVKNVKCNCSFIWCCHVKCDICKKEWVQHTCN